MSWYVSTVRERCCRDEPAMNGLQACTPGSRVHCHSDTLASSVASRTHRLHTSRGLYYPHSYVPTSRSWNPQANPFVLVRSSKAPERRPIRELWTKPPVGDRLNTSRSTNSSIFLCAQKNFTAALQRSEFSDGVHEFGCGCARCSSAWMVLWSWRRIYVCDTRAY